MYRLMMMTKISPSLRTKWLLSNRPITLFMMSTNNKTNDEKIDVAVNEAKSNETSSAQKIEPIMQKAIQYNQLLMMMKEDIKRLQSQKQKEHQQNQKRLEIQKQRMFQDRVKLGVVFGTFFFGTALAFYQAYFSSNNFSILEKSDNRQEKKEDPKLQAKLQQQTQEEKKRVQYKKLLEEYGKQNLTVEPYYVANNSTQQQFKQILLSQDISPFLEYYTGKFCSKAGLPGNGKSTSIKQIVNAMRGDNQNVYYINLRVSDDEGKPDSQKTIEKVLELSQLLYAVGKECNQNKSAKRPKLIVDDINQLGQLKKAGHTILVKNIENKLVGLAQQKVSFYLISSSSTYIEQVKENYSLTKSSLFFLIKPKTPEEVQKAVSSIARYFIPNISQAAIKFFVDEDYGLREVVRQIQEIKKNKLLSLSNDELLFKITSKREDQRKKKKSIIQKTLIKHNYQSKDRKYDLNVLKALLKLDSVFKQNGCLTVQENLRALRKDLDLRDDDLLNQFDQQNLLFYCYPRTKFVRGIFQDLLKSLPQEIEMQKTPKHDQLV